MAFASDKNAYGISDRSGFRYRLRDMKKEWTGALVGPDEYEPKHPQLYPPRVGPDPQALAQPAPDQPKRCRSMWIQVTVETPNATLIRAIGKVGQVTVVIT
jgi:hypothetical protein